MRNFKKAICLLMGCLFAFGSCGIVNQSSNDTSSSDSSTSVEQGKHTHTLSMIEKQDPTCTEKGKEAHWKCGDCGELFADKDGSRPIPMEKLIEISALGHNATHVSYLAPTEKKEGVNEHYKCDACAKYFSDEACTTEITENMTIIPMLSHVHSIVYKPYQAAYGSADGFEAHWECEGCKKFFLDEAGKEEISKWDIILDAPYSLVDFVVEVEDGRNPIVLQLTDTQSWSEDFQDNKAQCFDYVEEVVNTVKPDLILLTGDLIYGKFDTQGEMLPMFIEFMESLKTPWAPVFGNHDNESFKGVDWQCRQFETAQHCLFKQNNLTGNGNYTVAIGQEGMLKRVFFMMDTGGCNGQAVGFGQDQVNWFVQRGEFLKMKSPNTKISFAFHIQMQIFNDAYAAYGFPDKLGINISKLAGKQEGDFGYLGEDLAGPWDTDYQVWNKMKALGTDSIFIGHEHCNSASVVYEGCRFQFGQKSSTYDAFNSVNASGQIVGAYKNMGTPLIGGTVIPLDKNDGSIVNPYIYLCENAGGKLNLF